MFMKLVRQLIYITTALIGSNEEKHTKSSYTITWIEKLQISSSLRTQPKYSYIALYCSCTRDKFCSESTKIIVWGLDHLPPVDSLSRLTLWVSIYSLPRGYWRKWAQCAGDSVCENVCLWLWHMPYTTMIGLHKAKVLPQTLLNCWFQVCSQKAIKAVVK